MMEAESSCDNSADRQNPFIYSLPLYTIYLLNKKYYFKLVFDFERPEIMNKKTES